MEALSNRSAIEEHQVKRLRQMLHEVLKTNEFYRTKLSSDGFPEIDSLKKLKQLPFTTKTELVQDQIARPPFGSDLTFSLEKYIRPPLPRFLGVEPVHRLPRGAGGLVDANIFL